MSNYIVSVDTETTGLDPATEDVFEVALLAEFVRLHEGKPE